MSYPCSKYNRYKTVESTESDLFTKRVYCPARFELADWYLWNRVLAAILGTATSLFIILFTTDISSCKKDNIISDKIYLEQKTVTGLEF